MSSSSRGHRDWALVVFVVIVAAIVIAMAALHVAKREDNADNQIRPAASSATSTAPPQYSPAEQAAAKSQVCQVFDHSTTGSDIQGAVRTHGQLNVPVVLRTVNSVVVVQNSLTPATPPDVAGAAKKYIDASLDLTSATFQGIPTSDLTRLNQAANAATDGLADACGLPH